MVRQRDIVLKKKFGQHFLRDESVVDHMIDAVNLSPESSVLEIGPGDGFLTNRILQEKIARLWSFEIDYEWAGYLRSSIQDKRFTLIEQDFLTVDFSLLAEHQPWIILANLPYNITFPIFHLLQEHSHLFKEGVVMVQEEVAQRLVSKGGRTLGAVSLFFQWYFDFKLYDKIPPTAFIPPPKIVSRLVYLKPKQNLPEIPHEAEFWEFLRVCFKQPRRTLKNNLSHTKYDIKNVEESILLLRAQQLGIDGFLKIWDLMYKK